jgi:hypothetical protein
VHLDDDDLDTDDLSYLKLPTDEEAAESAAELRALMASFETQRHDEAARRLMAAERRAAADDLAAAHQSACQSEYLRNLAATDEVRAVATGRRPREDCARIEAERRLQYERARAAELARLREHQYPLPSYYADARIAEDAQRRRQQLREARLRRRLETGNHGGSGAGGYQFGVLRLRTRICKICLIQIKFSKFNESKFLITTFLGPVFWDHRCGSSAPKF